MNHFYRVFNEIHAVALLVCAFATVGLAAEQAGPELKEALYFGGSGDQGAAQDGMGIAVGGSKLYVSGADLALYGGQALVACYPVPPGSSPFWSFRWPNQRGNGWWNDETFPAVAVTQEGIYCAGRSSARYTEGGKENNAVLVKFPLTGATGPGVGGSLWIAEPHFFPYMGIETFIDVAAVQEGASTFLYATGRGQSDGSSNTAVLAKLDTMGNLLWKKVLGRAESYVWSQGTSLAEFNGYLYVAGYTHWHKGTQTVRPHTGLWKLDPSGNVVWYLESVQPITQNSLNPICVVPVGDSLFVAAAQENAPNGGADVLLLKYSQAGDLVWSKNWGSAKDDVPMAIAAEGNQLFLVGYTTGWVGGGRDAFLLQMNADNGEVLSASYHGGPYDDIAYGVKVVGKELYIVGDSKSSSANPGQSDVVLLRYALSREPPILNVRIDIKPGEAPNPINMKSQGKVPVAILSTPEFDAPKVVDKETIAFGRTGSEPCLAHSGCKPEDVNADGLLDLICHFETQKTGFLLGDTQGILKGKTLQGRPFMGIDSVVIKFPKKEDDDDKKKGKLIQPIKPPKTVTPPKVEPPKSGRTAHKGKPAKTQAEALRQMQKEGGVAY